MDPLLLGLSAPSIASTASAVGRAATSVVKPFASILHGISASSKATLAPELKLTDLQARADALQEDLEHRIYQAIDRSGVELDSKLHVRLSDLDGRLEVVSNHSQRTVVEAALASDPTIANDFRELAALKELLLAASKHEEFAEEYAHDPQRAVDEFTWQTGGILEANILLDNTNEKAHIDFDLGI